MAQTRLVATGITSKTDADKIAQAGEAVEGVRFVNVNHDDGGIVITHTDAFNVDTFKSAIHWYLVFKHDFFGIHTKVYR